MSSLVSRYGSIHGSIGRFVVLAFSLVVFAVALTGSASADLDTFTTGDGHEGAVTVSTNSVLNYSAPLNAAATAGATSLTTGTGQAGAAGTATTTGSAAQTQFEANRLALVIQSSNYTGPGATSGSQADIDLSANATGQWELARISTVTGSLAAGMTVNFANPLVNSYSSTGAQIVAIPEFTTVQINTNRAWSANAWNGTNGGITAFLANGTVNLSSASSSINANGDGFRGGLTYNGSATACTQLDGTVGGGKGEGIVSGVYPGSATSYASRGNVANGGGGGVCENSGGGGGGNGGQGGIGGTSYDGGRNVGGLGGTKLNYSAFDHAIFGGGGGAGDENNDGGGAGGNGGGLVFVRANSLTGSGTLSATGNDGADSANVGSSDGAGGGGAGGVVYARFNSTAACNLASVRGGAGGDEQSTGGVHGPGGGGAGGRLVLQSSGGTCPTNVGNGVGGVTTSGSDPRGSGPTSSTDATSSGATEAVTGGGGISTPTATVSTPANGTYVNSATPTITGTSSMTLGTIRMTIDGVYVGSVTTAANGDWSFTPGSALSAGSHTYTVRPVYYGIAGAATGSRTLIVDTVAPSVAISGLTSPTASGASQTATITRSDNVAVTSQTCQLDAGTPAACTTSFATGALSAGSHTITVIANDAAGNSTTQTATIVVDQTAPTVTISGQSTPTTSTASQSLTITAADNVALATVTCRVDSGANTSCIGGSYATGTLAAGSHVITVIATDTVGNATTQTATIVIDQTAPTVTVSGQTTPTNSTASQNLTITAADNVALATVTCRVDSGANTSCIGGTYATGALTAGSHTITVIATDTSGNQFTRTATIVVDTTVPTLAISGQTSPTALSTSQNLTITAADNVALATVTCRVDSGANTSCIGGTYATGVLAAGSHTITAIATDTAGNQTTQTATIVVDQTAPSVAISGLTSPTISGASQTATITRSDNVAIASQSCRLDSGPITACTTSYATGALANGSHTITVVATDTSGNSTTQTATIVVDQTAPTLSISGQTSPTASTASQSLTITAADNVALSTVTCRVDSGATSSCIGGTYATGTLTAGSHTITAIATDSVGNTTTQTATIVVDQTAPVVTISGQTTPTSSGASQSLTIAASDNVALSTVTCRVDSGATTSCIGGTYVTGALSTGSHTITVIATDTVGNSTTQTATIVVDQTSPVVTISGVTSPTRFTTSQTATIAASDNVAIASQTCRLNSGTPAACTTSFATGVLTVGTNTITVVATDTSGNVTTQTATIFVDQTAPSVSINGLTSPTNSTASQTAAITTTDNVAIASQTCRLDSGANTACTTSYATGVMTAGTHTITVVATDTAGNVTTQTATIVVDTTVPTLSISGLTTPTNSTASQTATITAGDNVALSTVTCRVDSGATTSCIGGSYATGTLAAGTHTLTVIATDTAGNQTTQTATVVVDQTNPTLSISGLTSPTSSSSSQTATITAADNVALSTVTCRVDSGATTSCIGGTYATGTLSAGSHTITVIATDTSGNQTTQTATVVVDQTAPTVAISGLTTPTNSTASQTATIAASDNVAIATQTCRLDSGANTPCTTSFATGAMTAGTHTITVIATDTVGNSTTQTATIVVDQTLPTVAITGLTSPTNSGASQTATITTTDNVAIATQTCRLDSGANTPCTTSFATGALSAGTHTITVIATDTAGNQRTQTATIVVDQTAPSLAISGLTSPTNSTSSQTATITASDNVALATVTCRVDSGATTSCIGGSYATGTLAAGSHTITVIATDTSGNQTTQTATIVVDTSSPVVTITPPTSPTASSASQNIAFTATDNGTITVVECRIDSGAFAPCTSPFATGTLTAGSHTVYVRATDNAANQTTQSVTIVVDQTGPAVTISGLISPRNSTTSQTATIGATDNVAVATVTCSIDGGASTSCIGGSYSTGTLAAGSHTLSVTATDTSGNATTQTATIVIDLTAPSVAITGLTNPTRFTTSQTATIATTDNVAIASQTCRLNSGTPAACTTSFATGVLNVGTNTVTVVATDTAGNQTTQTATIVVDQTNPTVSISGQTSPTASSASQSLTITAADNVALSTVTCRVDSGSNTSCIGGTYATGTLTAGSHTITVIATDTAGNQTTQTAAIVVDQTSPSVAISGLTSPTSSSASQTATIASSDNFAIASQTCRLDSGPITACTTSYSTGVLSAGSHTITVVATDTAGNVTTQTANIVVDLTAPTLSISGLTSPTASGASQTATITAGDNLALSTVTCRLDSGVTTSCIGGSYATGALTAGSHTITAIATDTAGNQTTQTATIIVDQTAPSVTISGLTSPTSSSASQTATIAASDNVAIATQTCRLDSGANTPCTTSFATGALAAGTHTITVIATDTSGNSTTQTATVIVDQTAPSIAISGLTSPTRFTTSQTATITRSDNVAIASQTCRLNSGTPVACTTSFATGTLNVGTNTITVVATDTSGNVTTQPATIVVDQTSPSVAITGLTSPTASGASQTATITASDNVAIASQTCSLNGGAATACTTSFATGALAAGSHTITVIATDTSGNSTTQSATIIVDQTAPSIAISGLTSPTNSTASQTATITRSDNVAIATQTCRLDSGAATACTTSYATGVLSPGSHTITVVATDTSGNSTTETATIIVDQTSPSVSISGLTSPANSTASQTATITASDNVAIATQTCRLDAGAATPCTTSYATGTLAEGSHTITVVATDTAGNTTTQTTSIDVDTTVPPTPTVTLVAPTSSPTNSTSAEVNFSANEPGGMLRCSIDGGAFSTCASSPLNFTSLADGPHSVAVEQVDAAGNIGSVASVAWTVDTTPPPPPTVTRTAPASSPTSSTSAEITFSANEPGGTLECSVDGGAFATCASSPVTLSGLADGSHTFAVRQSDAAGNPGTASSVNWTIDTAAPSAPSVSSNRTGTVSESTATITYSASESGGTLECSFDGGAWATCTSSPINLTGLTDGPHTYSVRQRDDAGNVDSAATVAWLVDLTAPSAPETTSPTGSPHYSATDTPTFSGTGEPHSTINLYDGATLIGTTTADASGDWSIISDPLSDGAHAITATATDTASNISSASAVTNVVVDTAAPTVAITAPATGSYINTPAATVSFSVTDANAGSTICQIDSGAFAPCTSGFSTPALSNGSHTITVQHTDLAGNTGSSSTTFTVDNATPTVAISSPSAFEHVSTAINTISFTVTDDNPSASSSCSVDGNAPIACSDPFQTAALSDGSHTVTVSHTDSAGNTGSAAVTFTVDTQAPGAPTITDAPNDPDASDEAEFSFTGAESGGSFECSLNGAAFTTCSSPANYLGLADGDYEFRVRQVDEAGNPGAIATHTWTIDTTPPNAPTLNGPSANTNNPESTVSFVGSPDTVELRCGFDGSAPATCPTSPLSLGELPDGNHSFTVEAFDAAGNSSTSTISWNVDTVAPNAPSITDGPVGSVPSPDATFEFTGAESGGIYRCSLDSLPAVNCSSPHDVTGLADGTYTFHVRQVDAAGNAGPMASRTWTIDTTPPAAPTVTGPSSPSGQTSALIEFTGGESGVTFECEVDGGGYSPCADPLSLTGLADGSHTVNVRAFDEAGNGSAPATFTWVVDSALFTADISGAPNGVVNSTSASLTLSASLPDSTFECSVDGSPFAACNSPVSLDDLAEGPHSFSVRALNGSQTTPSVTRSWTVDLTNPSVSISAPVTSSTTGPDTSIVFTTSDPNEPVTTTCKLDSASPAPCTSAHPYSNLSEGNHTVIVTATDAGGNSGTAVVTWHVDHTAPNAPQITQPASNGSTNDTTPTVGGTAEPNSMVKLYDGATLLATITANGSGAWSWTPSSELSERTYDLHATATDVYDNESVSSPTRSLTIDTSAPAQPAITEPSAGPTNDPTPLVKGTAEPGSTVTVYVDGTPISGAVTVDGSGNWEKLISPALADGPHTITAVTTDIAGNDSTTSDDLDLTVDTAAPSVSITSPGAAAQISTDSPDVTFTAESGATTRCQIDGGPLTACTSPFELSSLSEGAHTVTVEATDSAGNVATAVVAFTVDLTDPTAELTGGPAENGESSDDTPTFTFTSNEPGTFECSIDGGAFAPCTSPFTLPSLGEGPHTFTVRAVDQSGNPSSEITRSWTVDTLAPGAPSIDSPADGAAVADSTPTVSGNAGSAEGDSTISVFIDGTLSGTTIANPDGSWSYTVPTALADNTYAFTATSTDAAGNDSTPSSAVDIRVDVNDPIAEITAKPGTLSNDSTPTFTFSSNEPGTFECRIDSGAFAPCASPLTTAALADGAHTFYVRALDAGSNASAVEQWNWTIDTTPPDVTATPNSPAPGISPMFSFASTESGTTYRCRIDGSGAFTTCSSPYNAPTLAAGNHTLEIQFTDSAGNTGTKTVNFTVTAPATQPPPSTPTPTPPPTVPAPPVAETCTGTGDEPGIPANMTVLSAAASKNTIKFTTSSDKYILIRVAIYDGRKLVGTAVRANNPGKRVVAIKTKKALAKGKKFTIKLSAITMTGGKSVASTYMLTDKKGKATLVGADGTAGAPATSVVSCGPEKGAKKVKVNVATAVKVKVGVKKLTATAKASDWTIATFRIIQDGKTVGRRVFLLKPGKQLRAPLKVLPGKTLVKGKAMIQVSTCTVDGVWQQFKKPITVK